MPAGWRAVPSLHLWCHQQAARMIQQHVGSSKLLLLHLQQLLQVQVPHYGQLSKPRALPSSQQ